MYVALWAHGMCVCAHSGVFRCRSLRSEPHLIYGSDREMRRGEHVHGCDFACARVVAAASKTAENLNNVCGPVYHSCRVRSRGRTPVCRVSLRSERRLHTEVPETLQRVSMWAVWLCEGGGEDLNNVCVCRQQSCPFASSSSASSASANSFLPIAPFLSLRSDSDGVFALFLLPACICFVVRLTAQRNLWLAQTAVTTCLTSPPSLLSAHTNRTL